MIHWYIFQLSIHHNWQQIRLIVLIAAHLSSFQLNYLLCDMSRIIYTSFRQIIYNKPAYSWPHGINTYVSDPSREGRSRDNSWLQFNRLFNNRGTASPTQPQSVGGNYSPASALKPRILTYMNYSSTVSHYIFTSPCFYHSSENITPNISHNSHFILILQTRLLLSRAQG